MCARLHTASECKVVTELEVGKLVLSYIAVLVPLLLLWDLLLLDLQWS